MQIVFNGNTYNKKTLLSLTGFGHKEVISLSDLIVIDKDQTNTGFNIVFKYENKNYCLVRSNVVTENTQIECVVISKHILKKALISPPVQPSKLSWVNPHKVERPMRDRSFQVFNHEHENYGTEDELDQAFDYEEYVVEQPKPKTLTVDKAKTALDVLNKASKRNQDSSVSDLTDKTRKALSVLESSLSRQQLEKNK